jgi:hypothetical protein
MARGHSEQTTEVTSVIESEVPALAPWKDSIIPGYN